MENCFKERVLKFWDKFTEKESYIRRLMDNKEEIDKALDYTNNLLSIVFKEVYFEMGINDEDKYELILTPEGNKEKLFLLYEWYENANDKLKNKWNFYFTKPALKQGKKFNINMYDVDFTYKDAYIVPIVNLDEKVIHLKVYSEKLLKLNENQRYNLFFVFLDQYISEIYSMDFIGKVDFYEVHENNTLKVVDLDENNISKDEFDQLFEEDNEDINTNIKEDFTTEEFKKLCVSAIYLKSYIEEIIKNNNWKVFKNPFEKFNGYHMQPSSECDWDYREDIIAGATADISIINEYYNYSRRMYDRNYEDGVVYGFVFFENNKINQEEVVVTRIQIEDEIIKLIESKGIGRLIGGATGFYYSYMDFIIFDIKEFLEIAKSELDKYNFEESGFKTFNREDSAYMFK